MSRRGRLGILVAAAAAAAGVWVGREPLRVTWRVLRGDSPHCSFAQAIRSASHRRTLTETKDRILAASRRLEEDPAGYVLWDTPHGRFWITRGNDYFLPFHLAEQQVGIYDRPGPGVLPGDVVLDCGANVGIYTRHALQAGAKLVVAIEPAPPSLECLRRNLAKEVAAGRVIIYSKGVWDKEDWLTLYVDPENTAAASFLNQDRQARAVERVPLTTIDNLVAELALERVDFIKMDIEGAELNAIRGAAQTIRRFRPRLAIAAYHAVEHPELIPKLVREIDPSYRVSCGFCAESDSSLRPDVLFLH